MAALIALAVAGLFHVPVSSVASAPLLEVPTFIENVEELPRAEQVNVSCFCVLYLRETLGIPIYGDAKNLIPNAGIHVGAVALFKFEKSYHASLIVKLEKDGFLVNESNYKKCEPGIRFVPYNDPTIRGFWDPPDILLND